ncbi:alpha/beta fold hydrolase [Aneurinibacillus terranovensis]|uniref:alpha/beta fold hydrolase n=1 Tax=Aneurinibacillus terranovensis TaxID=278991 RepID=UPI0009D77205
MEICRAQNRWQTGRGNSDIRHRTLILAGEYDQVIPRVQCEQLHRDIKNSVFVIITESGHFLHEEKWQEVDEEIVRFLHLSK